MTTARPATATRHRRLAGRGNVSHYESAVAGPNYIYHRLQPDALIGTIRCGKTLYPGRSAWMHVDRVPTASRCQTCYADH